MVVIPVQAVFNSCHVTQIQFPLYSSKYISVTMLNIHDQPRDNGHICSVDFSNT